MVNHQAITTLFSPSRENAMRIAHLISSRNLAPGDRRTVTKSLKRFRELTETPFVTNPTVLDKLKLATHRIAGICTSIRGTSKLSGGHLSLNTAGTLDVPVSKGGKAADAILDITEFLNEIPVNGETINYPWGSRYYPSGRARWMSWGQATCPPRTKFLDVLQTETLGAREILAGVGDYTGSMIFTVAYTKYMQLKESAQPIPIRQATVCEPGAKARVVTTGPWWLTVIQQPLAHMLREHIAYHPSANSVMLRADQAWHAVRGYHRLQIDSLGDKYLALSSDLKEATDSTPHDVARVLIGSFIERTNPRWLWIIDLITDRLVFTEDKDIFLLKRGIMMGEPLSKVSLILLGLAVEEIAFSEELGLRLTRRDSPRVPWRCFHLGGDDHNAIGPKSYLKKITSYYRAAGAIISPTKHRMSRILVVYTERVIYYHDTKINLSIDELVHNVSKSCYVDSMKLRLLSPFSKAIEAVNDKNIAIGKIKGITKDLQYLPEVSLKRTIIDRALYKFRDFVKGPHHRTIRAVESLPIELGGLGIAVNYEYIPHLPPIFNRGIRSICITGRGAFLAQRALGSIFKNETVRGIPSHDFIEKWLRNIIDNPDYFPVGSLVEWKQQVDPTGKLSFRRLLAVLETNNVVSLTKLPNYIEKSYSLRRFLEEPPSKGITFRTETMQKRVARAWNELEAIGNELHPESGPLTEREIQAAIRTSKKALFINLNQIYSFPVTNREVITNEVGDEEVVESTTFARRKVKDILFYGQPSMTVSYDILRR